jgi:prevent-host-death family protein
MEKFYAATDARAQFAELLDLARYGGQRIVIQKSGKSVAVLIGYEDYAFMREREDEFDRRSAKEVTTDNTAVRKLQRRPRQRHLE